MAVMIIPIPFGLRSRWRIAAGAQTERRGGAGPVGGLLGGKDPTGRLFLLLVFRRRPRARAVIAGTIGAGPLLFLAWRLLPCGRRARSKPQPRLGLTAQDHAGQQIMPVQRPQRVPA